MFGVMNVGHFFADGDKTTQQQQRQRIIKNALSSNTC